MEINFIVHTFDKRDKGGVLRVISELANVLSQRDQLTINVFSLGNITELAFPLSNKINVISLGLIEYNTQFYSSYKKIKWFKDANDVLQEHIKRNEHSIWITSSPPLTLLFSIYKLFFKIKVIGCDHTSTVYKKNYFFEFLRVFLLRKLNVIVSLTKEDASYYNSKSIRSVYIPNGIDFNKISEIDNKRKYVIFVGRLSVEKRPFKAIELFINSKLYIEGRKFLMYGDGELKTKLSTYIKNEKLDSSVELITNVTDLDLLYKDAYALLLTSSIEGFGMVLLEAMSRGIPCIAVDCPYGPRNIIQNGLNGFLISDDIVNIDHEFINIKNLDKQLIVDSVRKFDLKEVEKKWFLLISEVFNES